MAIAVIALFTVLPLCILLVDLLRPRKDADAFAGPARTAPRAQPVQAAPVAHPVTLARPGRGGKRNDFFGDHLGGHRVA